MESSTDQNKKEEAPKQPVFGAKFAVASGGTFGGVALGADTFKKPAAPGTLMFGSTAKDPLFKPISGGTFGGVKLATKPEESVKPEASETLQNVIADENPA